MQGLLHECSYNYCFACLSLALTIYSYIAIATLILESDLQVTCPEEVPNYKGYQTVCIQVQVIYIQLSTLFGYCLSGHKQINTLQFC